MQLRLGNSRVAYSIVIMLLAFSWQSFAADPYGLPTTKPEKVGMSSERLARIKPAMQPFIDKGQVPGLLTVIARHGKIVHFEAQGYADIAKKTLLKPDAIFRMYSQSKIVNAVAVMMMFEEGKFLLDDPVADYLPEFRNMKVYTKGGLVDAERLITVRQLLTHTSGIATRIDHPTSKLYEKADLTGSLNSMKSGITLAEYVRKLATMPLLVQPGTQWNYGLNMTVLARLVEVWSGETYGAFLQKRIFDPLGMVDTGFYVPADKMHRFAALYEPDKNGGLVDITQDYAWDEKPSLEMGDTGLVSTAADYMRFFQMLLNGGELDGVRLLSPTTVNLIRSNHLPPAFGDMPLATLDYPLAQYRGLGFGLTVAVMVDPVAAGVAGGKGQYYWGGAADTNYWLDPEEGVIGMVLNQVLGGAGKYPVRQRMHQMTYQAIVE